MDLVRCIATARIVMPRTVVRLSAGRLDLSEADQALAFMAGANSIFDGDKLLTTPNNDRCGLAAVFPVRGGVVPVRACVRDYYFSPVRVGIVAVRVWEGRPEHQAPGLARGGSCPCFYGWGRLTF